jgi:hypothetical protein
MSIKPMDVSPPERTLFLGKVRNQIRIILIPNKPIPRNFNLPVEFVKMLQKQGIILHT